MRSAKPPFVNARTRLSVAVAWLYACTIRSGSGMRASAVGASSCTMWPRKEGISAPPTVSVGDVRAFASCPAIRPTFTTGSVAP